MMIHDYIARAKTHVREDDLQALMELYQFLLRQDGVQIDPTFFFKEVFLCSCSMGRKEIMLWLREIYQQFDPIAKMALKNVFRYAKYSINYELSSWYLEEFANVIA
ncbi:MAG: hypothetical protein ACYCOU_08540 [Sulfobacillus sp.]